MKAKDLIDALKVLDPETVVWAKATGCGCCAGDDGPGFLGEAFYREGGRKVKRWTFEVDE